MLVCKLQNKYSQGWMGIENSLGAVNVVPVPELADLPCAEASLSEALLIRNKRKWMKSVLCSGKLDGLCFQKFLD